MLALLRAIVLVQAIDHPHFPVWAEIDPVQVGIAHRRCLPIAGKGKERITLIGQTIVKVSSTIA